MAITCVRVLAAILVIAYCFIQAYAGGDFQIYMGAAELLREGKNCYNVWIYLGVDDYCGYSYSPLFAIFLIPFTFFPYPTAQVLWLFANLFFLYRLFKIIRWYLPLSSLTTKQYRLWVILSVILTSRFVLNNFEMVQMTIFLLYCCLEATYQLKNNKYILSGILISVGIIVKIMPIIMIPYFLYRKQIKPVIIAVVCLIVFLFLPVIIYGWEFNKLLLTDWWNIINFNNPELVYDNGEGIHSLSGFITTYFTDAGKRDILYRSTIIVLQKDIFPIVLNGGRLFFICMTLYFLKFPPFIKSRTKLHTLWELSYIFCITPLIFPHQQKYAFFFIAPAILYVIYFLIFSYNRIVFSRNTNTLMWLLIVLYFILAILTTDGIIGRHLSYISQHYKTITVGTFLMIIVLSACHPKRLNPDK